MASNLVSKLFRPPLTQLVSCSILFHFVGYLQRTLWVILCDCAVLPAGVSPFRLLVSGEGGGGSSDGHQIFLQWLSTRENQPIPNSLQERSAVWYSGAYGGSGIKGLHMRRSRSLSLLNLILLPIKPVLPYREDFCPMSLKCCLTGRQSSEPSLHTTTNWWTRTQVCLCAVCLCFSSRCVLSEIQLHGQTRGGPGPFCVVFGSSLRVLRLLRHPFSEVRLIGESKLDKVWIDGC